MWTLSIWFRSRSCGACAAATMTSGCGKPSW
jgi:hypothetical protein